MHQPAPRRVRAFAIALPIALAAVLGCDGGPTRAPEPVSLVEASFRPELDTLVVATLPWEFSLAHASTAPDEPLLAHGEYLTVRVETSTGDAEDLRLRRAIQEDGLEARWLTVTPKSSDAAFWIYSRDIQAAGALPVDAHLIYAQDDADAVARRLRVYPWVASVERRRPPSCETVDCITRRATSLDGGLVPTQDPPVPGDGRLSLVPPVTVTFTYTSTSGRVYTVTRDYAARPTP